MGQQIAANLRVALTFYWVQLGRQVRIHGEAKKLPDAECADDFKARPLGSKMSALASKQNRVLHSRGELEEGLREAQALLESNPDHAALAWAVYAVLPETTEFWQGAADRQPAQETAVRQGGRPGRNRSFGLDLR